LNIHVLYNMSKKRSSGLDFADRGPSNTNNVTIAYNQANGSVIQRNRSERKRLQGFQQTLTNVSSYMAPHTQRTFKEKFNVWLINEGGRQIFFGSWMFLHLLVVVFGFFNYGLSDDLVDARATFGITYRALFFFYLKK
jgi:NADPH oxidase 2